LTVELFSALVMKITDSFFGTFVIW